MLCLRRIKVHNRYISRIGREEEVASKKSTFFHLPPLSLRLPLLQCHFRPSWHIIITRPSFCPRDRFNLLLAQNGDGDGVAGQVQLLDELRQQVEAQRGARSAAARKHDNPWTLNAPKIIYRLITDLNLQVELASRAHTSTATIVINADVQVQDFVGRRRPDHTIFFKN